MVSFTINFEISEALSKLKGLEIAKILQDELGKGGDLILKDAKDKVHVISGDLKASGKVTKQGSTVEGGFDMPYAKKEEEREGGKYAGKHAYLGPSVEKNGPIIHKNMIARLEKELG